MKKIFKFTAISLCLILFFTILINNNIITANTLNPNIDEKLIERMINQENALAAYDVLFSTFPIIDNEIIYPEEYAGEYIEEGKLIIQLSDATEEKKNEYLELLKEYDCVEIKDVVYSTNNLNSLLDNIEQDIESYKPASYGIDTKENMIVIEVPESTYVLATQYLDTQNSLSKGTNYMPLKVIKGEYSQTQATDLVGGNKISHNGYSFTLGYGGGAYGSKAYVSSGHNTSPGSHVYYGGTQIGTLAAKQFNNNQVGDFSIITINSNFNVTNLVQYNDAVTVPINGVYSNPPVGTILYKFGAFGKDVISVVTKLNQTVTYDELGVTVKGITQTNIDYGTSQGGDSGGPYYIWRNYQWEFCGVHSGSNGIITNFTPQVFISGFTPKTN